MAYHEAGKGSRQRPGTGYADGWDAIWGKKMKWQDFATAPKDGVPFEGQEINIYRWAAYKPQARKQMNKAGRWQKLNEYGGWDNCNPPSHWRPLPEPPESN